MVILYILVFILVLATIIVIHEFGHYYFARRYNVLVHEFSLGMGPVLYQKEKDEINYSIRALPIGGYVSMSGEGLDNIIKKGNTVGIILNDSKEVRGITLDETIKPDFKGVVVDFDFSGEGEKLFITIENELGINEYIVWKNTRYYYRNKKQQRITLNENSFEYKTLWQRFMIIFAGPLMNFILAFLLLFIVGILNGKPNLETNQIGVSNNEVISSGVVITEINGNIVNSFNEIMTEVQNSNNAYISIKLDDGSVINAPLRIAFNSIGLLYEDSDQTEGANFIFRIGQVFGRATNTDLDEGMIVTSIKIDNSEELIITDLGSLKAYLLNNQNGNLVQIKTQNDLTVTYNLINAETIKTQGARLISVDLEVQPHRNFDFIYMITYPFSQMGRDVTGMIQTIGLLINPSSGVGVGDLAGPIGIFSLVKSATENGFSSLLIFTAFLSVNIGIINLVPIPALDGGRILFLAYEGIFRKKVNQKVENLLNLITFVLLLMLILFVSYNDILRL